MSTIQTTTTTVERVSDPVPSVNYVDSAKLQPQTLAPQFEVGNGQTQYVQKDVYTYADGTQRIETRQVGGPTTIGGDIDTQAQIEKIKRNYEQ